MMLYSTPSVQSPSEDGTVLVAATAWKRWPSGVLESPSIPYTLI
jgi:hypothetical protein